ncbi:MAG: hypothetical protein B7Y41_11420 [Hydrogenophilales bacterium 28-61-23]|nr:MAG: hypothetical protein B7Y41_11420 [Hydrogenophilales bacterium 28-61-23]
MFYNIVRYLFVKSLIALLNAIKDGLGCFLCQECVFSNAQLALKIFREFLLILIDCRHIGLPTNHQLLVIG